MRTSQGSCQRCLQAPSSSQRHASHVHLEGHACKEASSSSSSSHGLAYEHGGNVVLQLRLHLLRHLLLQLRLSLRCCCCLLPALPLLSQLLLHLRLQAWLRRCTACTAACAAACACCANSAWEVCAACTACAACAASCCRRGRGRDRGAGGKGHRGPTELLQPSRQREGRCRGCCACCRGWGSCREEQLAPGHQTWAGSAADASQGARKQAAGA